MTKIPKEKAVKLVKPPKKKYLTNKELLKDIEESRKQDKMTDELAKKLMLLCHRYAQRPEYANYSYNDDMQAFALLTACKVWRGFDPTRSEHPNPFAYFTTVFTHSFYQYLNAEKKQRNIRDELLINNGDNPSFGFLESDHNDGDDNYNSVDYNKLINDSDSEPEDFAY
jgi:DNA-directed RNA polymerase specialized sigma24 family protein